MCTAGINAILPAHTQHSFHLLSLTPHSFNSPSRGDFGEGKDGRGGYENEGRRIGCRGGREGRKRGGRRRREGEGDQRLRGEEEGRQGGMEEREWGEIYILVAAMHLTPASSKFEQSWRPIALAGQSISWRSVPEHVT